MLWQLRSLIGVWIAHCLVHFEGPGAFASKTGVSFFRLPAAFVDSRSCSGAQFLRTTPDVKVIRIFSLVTDPGTKSTRLLVSPRVA
jgi:hypothetical protein